MLLITFKLASNNFLLLQDSRTNKGDEVKNCQLWIAVMLYAHIATYN